MKQISEWIEEITKDAMQCQEKLLINDIIDIYNGKYEDYGSYLKEKKLLNDFIEERAKREKFAVFIKPLFLAEPAFTYAKSKGEEDRKWNK